MGLIRGLEGGVGQRSGLAEWGGLGGVGLIGGLGRGVDWRFGAWVGDVEAGGGARTGRWGLGRSTMELGVGRRARLAEQIGDEGAGRRAEG